MASSTVASSRSLISAVIASASAASPGSRQTDLVGRASQQTLILRIRHVQDSFAQRAAAGPGEQCFQERAEFHGDDLPAGGGEHALQAGCGDVRHHPVERLAVEVDDPHDLTEFGDRMIEDCLPHRALVEFGVTDQGVLTPGSGAAEGGVDVSAGDGAPDGSGGTDSHRSGRIVHRIGILGSARVALQTPELAQRGQVRLVEFTEQIVDGVQHRRRVRLDRNPVAGTKLARTTATS